MQIYDNAARPSKPTYSSQDEHGTSYPYADIANKPTTIYESSHIWNYDRPVYTNRPSVYHPLQLDYPQDEYDATYPDVSGVNISNEDVSNSVDYSKYRGNPQVKLHSQKFCTANILFRIFFRIIYPDVVFDYNLKTVLDFFLIYIMYIPMYSLKFLTFKI